MPLRYSDHSLRTRPCAAAHGARATGDDRSHRSHEHPWCWMDLPVNAQRMEPDRVGRRGHLLTPRRRASSGPCLASCFHAYRETQLSHLAKSSGGPASCVYGLHASRQGLRRGSPGRRFLSCHPRARCSPFHGRCQRLQGQLAQGSWRACRRCNKPAQTLHSPSFITGRARVASSFLMIAPRRTPPPIRRRCPASHAS